ncbi:hypothetical protein D3C71_923070 [compost metagenome]
MEAQKGTSLVDQLPRSDGLDSAQCLVVGDELVPLEVALIEAHHGHLRKARYRLSAFHAWYLLQTPSQFIDLAQGGVSRALVIGRRHHHGQDVCAGSIVLNHERDIAVVSRVRAQLGCAGVQITHLDPHRQRNSHHQQNRGGSYRPQGWFALRERGDPRPAPPQLTRLLLAQAALRCVRAHTHVRQQHG